VRGYDYKGSIVGIGYRLPLRTSLRRLWVVPGAWHRSGIVVRYWSSCFVVMARCSYLAMCFIHSRRSVRRFRTEGSRACDARFMLRTRAYPPVESLKGRRWAEVDWEDELAMSCFDRCPNYREAKKRARFILAGYAGKQVLSFIVCRACVNIWAFLPCLTIASDGPTRRILRDSKNENFTLASMA